MIFGLRTMCCIIVEHFGELLTLYCQKKVLLSFTFQKHKKPPTAFTLTQYIFEGKTLKNKNKKIKNRTFRKRCRAVASLLLFSWPQPETRLLCHGRFDAMLCKAWAAQPSRREWQPASESAARSVLAPGEGKKTATTAKGGKQQNPLPLRQHLSGAAGLWEMSGRGW